MDCLVTFEITVRAKAFPTPVTAVGLLSSVNYLVSFQRISEPETCPTLVTCVDLVTPVYISSSPV